MVRNLISRSRLSKEKREKMLKVAREGTGKASANSRTGGPHEREAGRNRCISRGASVHFSLRLQGNPCDHSKRLSKKQAVGGEAGEMGMSQARMQLAELRRLQFILWKTGNPGKILSS